MAGQRIHRTGRAVWVRAKLGRVGALFGAWLLASGPRLQWPVMDGGETSLRQRLKQRTCGLRRDEQPKNNLAKIPHDTRVFEYGEPQTISLA